MTDFKNEYCMHTATCGELRKEDIGREVVLTGWAWHTRDHGGIIFCDLRDRDGYTQVIIDPDCVTADEFAIGISYIDRGVEAKTEEYPVSIVYPTDGIPWVPEGVAVFKNSDNVEAAKYFVEWLFSNDDNLRMLAEIDKKDGLKLVKPSLEGVELGYDTAILMEEDLSLFGSQRTEILDRFEALMGDKAANE